MVVVVVGASVVVVVVGAAVVVVVGAEVVVLVVVAIVVVVVVVAPSSTITEYWQPLRVVNTYVPYTELSPALEYTVALRLNIHDRLIFTPSNAVRL
jgi:hypothetical protein